MHIKHIGASAILSLALAACGGGGGGPGNTASGNGADAVVASSASFPVSGTATSFRQSSTTFHFAGTDSANKHISFTLSSSPGTSTSFEGSTVDTSMINFTSILINGIAQPNSSATMYFQTAPFLDFGEQDSDGQYYVVDVSSPKYLPTTAKVGDSGAMNSTTVYADSTKSTVVERLTSTWSLEADTASTAYLCFTDVHTPVPNDGSGYTEAQCLKINTAGTVLAMKITEREDSGTTLLMQSQ